MKRKNNKCIVVVGLGRIGLPFALFFARKNFTVFGVDMNPAIIQACWRGTPPFRIELSRPEFQKLIGSTFFPSTDYGVCRDASYILITVGGASENPRGDVSAVWQAIRALIPFLRSGKTVIIRSTVFPGTTKKIANFIQSRTQFRVGKEVFLAYCPERGLEGRIMQELKTTPQIIGADDLQSQKRAALLFRNTSKKLLFSNSISAELAKIFSNIHRYSDFAVANACMLISDRFEQDIHEIVRLVNTGYSRGFLKLPGLTGGPCLPRSPFLLPAVSGASHIFQAVHRVHEHVPRFLVRKIKKMKGGNLRGLKVAMLGVAFKGDTDNTRGSVALKLAKSFMNEGCQIRVHDSFVFPANEITNALRGADIVVIGASHSLYRKITIAKLRKIAGKKIVVCDPMGLLGERKIVYEA